MFTADDARKVNQDNLDERIQSAVENSSGNSTYLRVYIEDSFCSSIRNELEKRGFKNIDVPDIILKGDVYFEW
jgi:Fe-S cluster assembly iron-binding protein IscA